MGEVADYLHGTGKGKEATAMYREVLAARERVLGPEHKETLAARPTPATRSILTGSKAG